MGLGYEILTSQTTAIMWAVGWLALLTLLRLAQRNDTASLIALTILLTMVSVRGETPLFRATFSLPMYVLYVYILRRFGLLALTATLFIRIILRSPLTFDFNAWYAPRSTAVLFIIGVIAAYGFYVSLAGKPVLGGLEEEEPATS